ncbi:DUF397 domain-containing protein [Streptomyces sp. MST-110588]|uniref:DUF397 domain-containing protein n=1 Tax=Streptomyces sp. MST-110588 TaxID=2833628 RepID=UPI001F5D1767|nr:DUF397 domain-containing protein [Streptomyces sp. MST-110588]UNO40557.1 DUF397 domain-containing protein [Streptomyces sp. MST-110588]
MSVPKWQKSSFSGAGGNQDCIEVSRGDGGVWFRESDRPEENGRVGSAAWSSFLRQVRDGAYDRAR